MFDGFPDPLSDLSQDPLFVESQDTLSDSSQEPGFQFISETTLSICLRTHSSIYLMTDLDLCQDPLSDLPTNHSSISVRNHHDRRFPIPAFFARVGRRTLGRARLQPCRQQPIKMRASAPEGSFAFPRGVLLTASLCNLVCAESSE